MRMSLLVMAVINTDKKLREEFTSLPEVLLACLVLLAALVIASVRGVDPVNDPTGVLGIVALIVAPPIVMKVVISRRKRRAGR